MMSLKFIPFLALSVFALWGCPEESDTASSDGNETSTDGDTDTDADADGDSSLKSACKSDERVGAFSIHLAEDYTTISGSVSNGVKPSSIPETILEEGTCALLGPQNLFCDPACSITQTCGFDETCIEAPTKQSAGTVTIEGMNTPVSLDPNGITFDYSLRLSDPYPGFNTGADVTLTAQGDVFDAFTLKGVGPSQIEPLNSQVMVDRDAPVTIEWKPGSNAQTQIHINLTLNVHGATMGWIVCDAADNGSFEIPATLVTRLIDLGLSGFPKIELTRKSIDTTNIAEGCVELSVQSMAKLDVLVAGLTSCNDDSECEDGQFCNDELVCE